MDMPHFAVDRPIVSTFWAITDDPTMNIPKQVFVQTYVLVSLGYIPGREITGS